MNFMLEFTSMRGVLLLAVLSVKSSYLRNLEVPLQDLRDVPDTLQWWFGEGGCWRIRTYALDHDIHTYEIGKSPQTTLELALENNQRHYGNIIAAQHEIHFADCNNRLEVEAEFARIGLVPRIEIAPDRFVFWEPDDGAYSTKSTPRKGPKLDSP